MEPGQLSRPKSEKALVSGDDEGRQRFRGERVDGSDGAHNPKVGGSNPPPATKEVQVRARFWRGLLRAERSFYRPFYRVEAGRESRLAKIRAASACMPGRTC